MTCELSSSDNNFKTKLLRGLQSNMQQAALLINYPFYLTLILISAAWYVLLISVWPKFYDIYKALKKMCIDLYTETWSNKRNFLSQLWPLNSNIPEMIYCFDLSSLLLTKLPNPHRFPAAESDKGVKIIDIFELYLPTLSLHPTSHQYLTLVTTSRPFPSPFVDKQKGRLKSIPSGDFKFSETC